MQATHRSGPLKQKNKAHQTLGHKSNRQVKQKQGGKVGRFQSLFKKNKLVELRNERKNRDKDLKNQKRLNAFNLKRSLGQLHNAPYIVTILNLSEQPDASTKLILDLLTAYDEDANVERISEGNSFLTGSELVRLKKFQSL